MDQAEDRIAKNTRKKLSELFEKNDFSLELDAPGAKIYIKGSDHIVLGEKDVTFTTPLFRDVMSYHEADGVFSTSYFSEPREQPPSTLELCFDTVKKSADYLSKKSSEYISEISERFTGYKRAA